jgi:hypothetical protein
MKDCFLAVGEKLTCMTEKHFHLLTSISSSEWQQRDRALPVLLSSEGKLLEKKYL